MKIIPQVCAFDRLIPDVEPAIAHAAVGSLTRERQALKEAVDAQREEILSEMAQQRAIQEISTPIIPVLKGVIVMPLIGSVDTMRVRDVTRSLLAGIREHRARVVIGDITGVPIVDSGVAAYLNKTIQATRLKGARAIVTGVSDAVAETIVNVGIDWSGIETLGDLQTGLRSGFTEDVVLGDSPQQIADHLLEAYGRSTDDALVLVARYVGGSACAR